MKTLAILILLSSLLFAQVGETNILTYYAVDNSIDGQIMLDKNNYLRFVPVFALKGKVVNVTISIYSGSTYYSSVAASVENGAFWQALLPKFNLGDVIQRVEVEMKFTLDKKYKTQFDEKSLVLGNLHKTNTASIKEKFNRVLRWTDSYKAFNKEQIVKIRGSLGLITDSIMKKQFEPRMTKLLSQLTELNQQSAKIQSELEKKIAKIKNPVSDNIQAVISQLKKDVADIIKNDSTIKHTLDSLKNDLKVNLAIQKVLDDIDKQYAESNKEIFDHISNTLAAYDSASKLTIKGIASLQNEATEEITARIERDVIGIFRDPEFSGQGVFRSDILIDENLSSARILYRNYKSTLRRMPAIDPTERMGIFRARYVPFPITSKDGAPLKTLSQKDHVVFEFGVAFGEVYVPSDDFIPKQFSINNFGVAIALTEKLFDAKAELIGLALSYDVNSYVNLSYGVNVANERLKPYMSMGINRRAFEGLMKTIAGAFK